MSRRARINAVWLTLSGLLIATGVNVAVHESWAVAVLIAVVSVGVLAAVLIPGAVAGRAVVTHARETASAIASIEAARRKELTP